MDKKSLKRRSKPEPTTPQSDDELDSTDYKQIYFNLIQDLKVVVRERRHSPWALRLESILVKSILKTPKTPKEILGPIGWYLNNDDDNVLSCESDADDLFMTFSEGDNSDTDETSEDSELNSETKLVLTNRAIVNDKVVNNGVVVKKVLEYAGLNRPWRYRLLNQTWYNAVGLVHRKDLVAKCPNSFVRSTLEDMLCTCDMTVIGTSLSSPFPIRHFKLGNCWKNHLEKMNGYGQVEMESLELAKVPMFGRNIMSVPLNRTFILEEGGPDLFNNVNENVTSLPDDLMWLDTSLSVLCSTITQARFEKLKKLTIKVTSSVVSNLFSEAFYEAASRCLTRNANGLPFELPLLDHLDISWSNFVINGQFERQLAEKTTAGLCNAAPNLRVLFVNMGPEAANSQVASIFKEMRPLANLKVLALCPEQNQAEVRAVVDFLTRCKAQHPGFSLKALTVKCNFFVRFRPVINLTQLFQCVAESITYLEICRAHQRMESAFTVDSYPVMPRVTTLIVDLGLLLSLPSLNLGEMMPALETCHFHQPTCQVIRRGTDVVGRRDAHRIVTNATSINLLFDVEDVYGVECKPVVTRAEDGEPRPQITIPVCRHVFSIEWICPTVTSLTLKKMPCASWLLRLLSQDFPFPNLATLDVNLRLNDGSMFTDSPPSDTATLFDFAFTGLPDQVIQEYASFQVDAAPVNPKDVIPLENRERCLLHVTSLRNLTVRVHNSKSISDRSGYHGFAFMTYLESFTLMESEVVLTCPTTHALSSECRYFMLQALAPKVKVDFLLDFDSESTLWT